MKVILSAFNGRLKSEEREYNGAFENVPQIEIAWGVSQTWDLKDLVQRIAVFKWNGNMLNGSAKVYELVEIKPAYGRRALALTQEQSSALKHVLQWANLYDIAHCAGRNKKVYDTILEGFNYMEPD